jgi:hypothetical protein
MNEANNPVLERMRSRLSEGNDAFRVLGLQVSAAPPSVEQVARKLATLRNEVIKITAPLPVNDELRVEVLQHLLALEERTRDPVACYVVARANGMGRDPNDPEVRAAYELTFLKMHLPKTTWALSVGTSRAGVRLPVVLEVETSSGGKTGHAFTINLGRGGACLSGAPDDLVVGSVVALNIIETSRVILAARGTIAWRLGDRAGVHFPNEPAGIGELLRAQLQMTLRHAERFLELAPTDGQAIACVAIARAAADEDEASTRAAQQAVEFLGQAAKDYALSLDVQLALAKVCLQASLSGRAASALQAAKKIDSLDARYVALQTAASRAGVARFGFLPDSKVKRAAVAMLFSTTVIAVTVLFVMRLRGPYQDIPYPSSPQVLACSSAMIAKTTLICYTTRAALDGDTADVEKRAAATRVALADRGVEAILVYSRDSGVLLRTFIPKRPAPPVKR